MSNQFWDSPTYNKTILIIPNYTHFGSDKNINADSFVLVMREFISNSLDLSDVRFIIPYPSGNIPTSLASIPNIDLRDMGPLSTFPQTMRTQFPQKFFKRILGEETINLIWSHLPEWTNQVLINRRYTPFQPVIGYSHWWEIKDNGGYQFNSFVDNINGILQMEVCGVNSQWVKDKVLERAGEIFNDDIISKLSKIIQPWYLGMNEYVDYKEKNDIPTFLFNHRINDYTGGDYFFKFMDTMWDKGYKFQVYTSNAEIDKPYVVSAKAVDRDEYLENISKAHFGIGTFKKYSAWSMSVTDGLSVNVPYLLPKGLCYEEMVGENYPYLYDDRKQFELWVEQILQGKFEQKKINLENIANQLSWDRVLMNWDVNNILLP
jgi:hypothetical protein